MEDEFDKDILSQIQEKFEAITLPDGVQFVDGGTAAPSNFFPLYDQYDWKKLIVIDVVEVKSINDIYKAFDSDLNNNFKTVMKWEL